ncbi:MAG: beta-galactosidase [bacterium]|nr:beta-galactosidase [bacterium]
MRIGVDYYPEQWEPSQWEIDADRMKEIGVTTVRIGEFTWSRLERKEGEFQFEWLDQVVKLFSERQIEVVLCTPTNCPPLWLYEKYEDAIQVDGTGKRVALGIRGHRCYNSPSLRYFAKRIIEEMCKRYGNNSTVIGWQIDNELETNHCHCEYCTKAFRQWMKKKYHTVEAINEAYQNTVWSGEYSSFEQIKPPYGEFLHWQNPSYMLDYSRFATESLNEYIRFQLSIIRQHTCNQFVTTNTYMCEHMPDFYSEFEELDVVGYDNYPLSKLPEDSEELYSHAFHLDLMRGIKRKNFWIMEQLSGMTGSWGYMAQTPRPGMIKGYAMQAIAHGADAVLHFRYRTARAGAEMFWHGLLDASNKPGRRFEEFVDLCKMGKQCNYLDGTKCINQVAILYNPEDEFAFKIQYQEKELYYFQALKAFHHACTTLGVGVDIINGTEELAKYKIVVAPTLFIENKVVTEHLYEFVENGGTCILTYRSGVKDENNVCVLEELPGALKTLTGCYVMEYDGIGDSIQQIVKEDQTEYEITSWCELLQVTTAKQWAAYKGSFYEGTPAITVNQYGAGTCFYVGCIGKKAMYRDIMVDACQKSGIAFRMDLPEGVELSVREDEKMQYIFYFNNSNTEKEVDHMSLQPFEMKILPREKA